MEQMQENSNLTASVCLTAATDVEQEMQEKHSNKGKEGERISATQKYPRLSEAPWEVP